MIYSPAQVARWLISIVALRVSVIAFWHDLPTLHSYATDVLRWSMRNRK